MKRFHVHLHVSDIPQNLRFYSALFGTGPVRVEADYAKWMLQDPPVNFAISTRGAATGIDHLGIQAGNDDELGELKARAIAADTAVLDDGATACCYANSNKHWVTDPQGLAWEHFHTLSSIPTFGKPDFHAASVAAEKPFAVEPVAAGSACCGPASAAVAMPKTRQKACC